MPEVAFSTDDIQALSDILGYLNFSEGAADARLLANLNRVYRPVYEQSDGSTPLWRQFHEELLRRLEGLAAESDTFRDSTQASSSLSLAFDHVIPSYLEFHRDLLAHQKEDFLFGPLMIGRIFEAVLRQPRPWDDQQQVLGGAIASLCDYIGYRPVAVLESERKIAPYANEWVRPVPLYVRDVGVGVGRY
ncbi:MAG: hypothetical protein MI757_15630, partial [Pirellulales bacterium]|nr:hypothetical protein [Pirellulales bacterium]